jgi:hypothetical protein
MAFPFLNGLSFWTFLPGCLVILYSFFLEAGAAAAGWTSYPPLSALRRAVPGSDMGQTFWIIGMVFFIASFTMGGLNFVTTILNMRTKGLSLLRMPLTMWAMLLVGILGLLAFPALIAASLMLLFDRHMGTSFFLPAGIVLSGKVMPNKGGSPLLQPDAIDTLKKKLIPLAAVITPNIPEAEHLAGIKIHTVDDMRAAARQIMALGCKAALIKGGHLEGDAVTDLLVDGSGSEAFVQRRVHTTHTHGTGCALASGIATGLAQGLTLRESVTRARAYVHKAIEHAPKLGHGHGPLGHAHTVTES